MLLHFFRWADHLWIAESIRASTWSFALIEVFHLFGLTLLLGTVCVVNLRLFGAGLKSQKLGDVATDAMPFTAAGIIVTMGSGFLLFASEAMKCYASTPFMAKMVMLFAALLFTFFFQRHMTRTDQPSSGAKIAAGISLLLWFGVGLAGRAIAFF